METRENQRLTWAELPSAVQKWVEETQGSAVLTAESQNSGFSLGTADRLTFADGTRAFLKAVNEAEQAQTAALNRSEIKAIQMLPTTAPVASLLASYDQDGWVALLLEDIEGHHPEHWSEEEILAGLKALDAIAGLSIADVGELDELTESIGEETYESWEKIATQSLHKGLYKHLADHPLLAELEPLFIALNERAAGFAQKIRQTVDLTGSSMVHTDIRADNMLMTNSGEATIIDWPWACHGAAYFDSAALLANVVAQGGDFDWDAVCAASSVLAATPRETLESCIIAIAGYYIWAAQIPPRGDTSSSLPAARLKNAVNMARWILS